MRLLAVSLITLFLSGCGINLQGTYQGFENVQNNIINPGLGNSQPQLTLFVTQTNGVLQGNWTRTGGGILVGATGQEGGQIQGNIINENRIQLQLISNQNIGGTGQCTYTGFAVLNNDRLEGQITGATGCAINQYVSSFILNRISN